MRCLLALLVAGLLAMGNAQSNNGTEDPKAGKLTVTGSATVTVEPDIAKVFLSVTVIRPTAKEAREVAAATTSAVIAEVGAVEGVDGEKDVTTENISVQPNYVWEQETQKQGINGYTFSQSMKVTVGNLTSSQLGAVVDAAVRAGGNNLQVSSIQTDLSPEVKRAATNEARSLAVEDGAATADILAQAANVTLGGIKAITDTNIAPPTPVYMAGGMEFAKEAAAGAAAPTPVQVGTADVTATVTIEYAIANK